MRLGPTSAAAAALVLLGTLGCATAGGPGGSSGGPAGGTTPTIAATTRGLTTAPGLLPLTWDAAKGRLLLEVPRTEAPLLYVVGLPSGLGSNDVGLDRGQLGTRVLVEFRRVGKRLLLVAPNLRWRSSSPDEAVRTGAREAFAESVLWSFDPVAEEDGRVLVDATPFLLRDAHGIAGKLQASGQGKFALDAARSTVVPDSVEAFPENVQVDVLQTFASDHPGPEVRATTPVPDAVTLRVRQAFVALPDLATHGYTPRAYHPRSGFFPTEWTDVAAPLGRDTEQRVVTRHLLTPEHPLVYYVDRAAPEPFRTALLEGARYWVPVFDREVFPGAFRVELLPEGADPDDVRRNVVEWVERSTRGWSYGDSLTDPRTGEILCGHVTLGALRVRRDFLLFEGLTSPWQGDVSDPAVTAAALARLRQLAAHEIGHTLGLEHDFASSADGRASVMDYPPPRVTLTADGAIDLSDAYAPGCGAWDELAIRYGYGRFDDEAQGLRATLDEMTRQGLHFLTDADARGSDRAHPLANLWDDGKDPVATLQRDLAVRAVALDRFGVGATAPERPRFDLERALVPLYLHHRYQLEAVVRQVGGRWYRHVLAGEEDPGVTPVAADDQRRALTAALATLDPAVLRLPPRVLALLAPPPPGSARDRDTFAPTGPLFDAFRAADAAADLTLSLLLDPARCSRVLDQALADPAQLSLTEVFGALLERWFPAGETDETGADRALADEVRGRVLLHWMALAGGKTAPERVAAAALDALQRARTRLEASANGDSPPLGERDAWLLDRLRRFLEDPRPVSLTPVLPNLPPGSPIGCGSPPLPPAGPWSPDAR